MHTFSPRQTLASDAGPRFRDCLPGAVVAALFGCLLLAGCAAPPPPYVPAFEQRPQQAHCFDGVPHLTGSKPWVLGGRCCCTPTDDLMERYHRDGVCTDMDVADLVEQYHAKGIVLATDPEAKDPRKWSKHVVLGGNSLVPPRPGTRDYEQVITGVVHAPPVVVQK